MDKIPLTTDRNVYLRAVKENSKNTDEIMNLYAVIGVAPTYTLPLNGQKFENVLMNWWIFRTMPLRINYQPVIGDDFTIFQIDAVNQFFLWEEAKIYCNWLNNIYPEENTEIYKVKFPTGDIVPYTLQFDRENLRGSLWSNHFMWHYDWRICYYIDLSNCKKL